MTVTNWDCYLESLKKYGQFTYIVLKPKAVEHFKKNWREREELGICYQTISACCRFLKKTAGGYKWEYLSGINEKKRKNK